MPEAVRNCPLSDTPPIAVPLKVAIPCVGRSAISGSEPATHNPFGTLCSSVLLGVDRISACQVPQFTNWHSQAGPAVVPVSVPTGVVIGTETRTAVISIGSPLSVDLLAARVADWLASKT